eukprot:763327-Hanusia_phi.AAC.1
MRHSAIVCKSQWFEIMVDVTGQLVLTQYRGCEWPHARSIAVTPGGSEPQPGSAEEDWSAGGSSTSQVSKDTGWHLSSRVLQDFIARTEHSHSSPGTLAAGPRPIHALKSSQEEESLAGRLGYRPRSLFIFLYDGAMHDCIIEAGWQWGSVSPPSPLVPQVRRAYVRYTTARRELVTDKFPPVWAVRPSSQGLLATPFFS